jgi:hypothetical protein
MYVFGRPDKRCRDVGISRDRVAIMVIRDPASLLQEGSWYPIYRKWIACLVFAKMDENIQQMGMQ